MGGRLVLCARRSSCQAVLATVSNFSSPLRFYDARCRAAESSLLSSDNPAGLQSGVGGLQSAMWIVRGRHRRFMALVATPYDSIIERPVVYRLHADDKQRVSQ